MLHAVSHFYFGFVLIVGNFSLVGSSLVGFKIPRIHYNFSISCFYLSNCLDYFWILIISTF